MKNNKQLFKHQVIVTGILVVAVVISAFGGSYALFNSQAMGDEYNVFKEDDFEISYVDNGKGYGDILSLVNQQPLSDEEGSNQTPYRFNVTNASKDEKKFVLKIELDQAIIDEDKCHNKPLNTKYIKYKFDNQETKILSSLELNDYEFYISSETLTPGSSEIHELRIWLAENSPISTQTQHFHSKLTVLAYEEEKEYKEYQINQAVTLLDGGKYHVISNSNSKNSRVKLLSDYNIDETGVQDTNCVINKAIEEKIASQDNRLYCSTMDKKKAATVLHQNYKSNLKTKLTNSKISDTNLEVREISKEELNSLLGNYQLDQVIDKNTISNINWLVNSNYWTSISNDKNANYYSAVSVDDNTVSVKEYDISSQYFGLRPVIIIDKAYIK